MSSKEESRTTAVEAPGHTVGEFYNKTSDGLEPTGSGSQDAPGSYEMGNAPAERVELAHAIAEIESKKKAWYAYLLTRDFWIVLVLG